MSTLILLESSFFLEFILLRICIDICVSSLHNVGRLLSCADLVSTLLSRNHLDFGLWLLRILTDQSFSFGYPRFANRENPCIEHDSKSNCTQISFKVYLYLSVARATYLLVPLNISILHPYMEEINENGHNKRDRVNGDQLFSVFHMVPFG